MGSTHHSFVCVISRGAELSTSYSETFLSANFCRIVESLFVLHKSLLALKWVQITEEANLRGRFGSLTAVVSSSFKVLSVLMLEH